MEDSLKTRTEDISNASYGLDVLVIHIDLGAEAGDDHVDDIGLGIETVSPQGSRIIVIGAARIGGQEGEAKTRLQLDRPTQVTSRVTRSRLSSPRSVSSCGRRRGATDKRLNTRDQFGKSKRLGEVIVATASKLRARDVTELFALRKGIWD